VRISLLVVGCTTGTSRHRFIGCEWTTVEV
jgi:hypothetical protein